MRRIATILLAIWGITIVYFQEARTGYVYINNSHLDSCQIVDTETGTVRHLTNEGVETTREWEERVLRLMPNGLRDPKAIIVPYTAPDTEAPVKY